MSVSTENPDGENGDRDKKRAAETSRDPQNSQISQWSKGRLHADVQRAIGGALMQLRLLREVSRVSHCLHEDIKAEWMVKRVQFLAYELQSLVREDSPEHERLAMLNRFLFEDKGYKCVDPRRLGNPTEAFRLDRVLMDRAGAPLMLELLYAYLAERVGVSLDFVDLKPTCFLRWNENGRSRYIDITRGGATLSSDELIETLHTRFRMTSFSLASVLEDLSFESYLADYLNSLKLALDGNRYPEKMLFLQDTLIEYQPSNLKLLGERALLHRRLGNFKNALADLKRYFAFHDRAKAPADLNRLHDELTAMYEPKGPVL